MAGTNVDEMQKATLIKRSKRVAFMNVGTSEEPSYVRMQGFTSMSESKSPTEYSRQYVDEDTERTDVVGYATQIAYSFDRHSPFSVHEKLAQISDDELTGSDTHVDIVSVDLFADGTEAYENLNDKIQDLNKEYSDAVESRTEAIAGAYGLFDEFNMDTDLTSDDLLNNLQGQVDGLEQWMWCWTISTRKRERRCTPGASW